MTTGIVRDRSEKLGFPPGSLIFVGEQKTDTVVLTKINYDAERFEEKQFASIIVNQKEDCLSCRDLPSTTWIHVCGLHNPDIIESLGRCYGIHHLFLEDILNTAQRPKMEDLEGGLFIVMKAFTIKDDDETTASRADQLYPGGKLCYIPAGKQCRYFRAGTQPPAQHSWPYPQPGARLSALCPDGYRG